MRPIETVSRISPEIGPDLRLSAPTAAPPRPEQDDLEGHRRCRNHAEASVRSGAQDAAPDDFGEQGQNAVWASVREPLSPTGSFRPDRVTIEWRQK